MNTFKSGDAVELSFNIGGVQAPASVRRRVIDEEGNVVADWENVPTGIAFLLTIRAEYNTLVPPQVCGVRIVELEAATDAGKKLHEQAYILETSHLLVAGVNSFQTYYQAVLLAHGYAEDSLGGWAAQPAQEQRQRALNEAFDRIRLLPVVIEWEADQTRIISNVFNDPPRLRDLGAEEILRLDPRILKALRQAQLLEANDILVADPIRELRRAGIQSHSTGESSQVFGMVKPMDRGVCEAAAKVLARWTRGRVRVARA